MCIFEIFEKKYFICRLYLLEKFFSLFQALNLNRRCLVHSPDKVFKDETKYNHIFYPPFDHHYDTGSNDNNENRKQLKLPDISWTQPSTEITGLDQHLSYKVNIHHH